MEIGSVDSVNMIHAIYTPIPDDDGEPICGPVVEHQEDEFIAAQVWKAPRTT